MLIRGTLPKLRQFSTVSFQLSTFKCYVFLLIFIKSTTSAICILCTNCIGLQLQFRVSLLIALRSSLSIRLSFLVCKMYLPFDLVCRSVHLSDQNVHSAVKKYLFISQNTYLVKDLRNFKFYVTRLTKTHNYLMTITFNLKKSCHSYSKHQLT